MSELEKSRSRCRTASRCTIGEQLEVDRPQGQADGADSRGHHSSSRPTDAVELSAPGDEQAALHGLTRALAANAVQGVSTGFTRELDIVGIGYRADVKGQIATFTLGYSHPIEVLLPDGVDLKIDKQTHLVLSGYDQQMLGQVAANIRALRKPDPYKNKGIRYTGEVLRKKVGKTGAGATNDPEDQKKEIRRRIHKRIRRKVRGTPERPRLAVFRSVAHIYAQVIDDAQGKTLVSASSVDKDGKTNGRQRGGGQGHRQAGGRARQGKGHHEGGVRSRRLSSITAASRRWPTPRGKRDWSSNGWLQR